MSSISITQFKGKKDYLRSPAQSIQTRYGMGHGMTHHNKLEQMGTVWFRFQ